MRWSAALALIVASIETPSPPIGEQIADMLRPSMNEYIDPRTRLARMGGGG